MVKLGKDVSGEDIIILEETEYYSIVIPLKNLDRPCEEVLEPVRRDRNHPLRGKTLKQAILEDFEDRMGWGKYKRELKELGILGSL